MIRLLGTAFVALLGLAFGSFLNVCASRWPEGKSVVTPRSHCPKCGHMLAWWENIPVLSWVLLRGRCHDCKAWIGWRYPLAELAVGVTWAVAAWQALPALYLPGWTAPSMYDALAFALVKMVLCWLLVCLAVLDAEHLWLPDRLTLGGAALGLLVSVVRFAVSWTWSSLPLHWSLGSGLENHREQVFGAIVRWLVAIILAPAIILLIRWTYKILRQREGVGLGDAKLMLLLAAWLGLSHTILAFVLGVTLGAVVALVVLVVPSLRRGTDVWQLTKLPLGTFLAIAGIASALWGRPIIDAYLAWCGF